jgi:hypothetical protein
MNTGESAGHQRSANDATTSSQAGVERVDFGGRDLSDGELTEVRVEIAVEHGAGLADRGWSPTRLGDGEPCLE